MTRNITSVDSTLWYKIKLSLIFTWTYCMTLPKSLKIFGLKFKVKVAPLNGILGLCDRETKTIYIESRQSDREKWHTLTHEIGHAVFGRVGLVQGINPDLEEVIVDAIATALVENLDMAVRGSIPPELPQE